LDAPERELLDWRYVQNLKLRAIGRQLGKTSDAARLILFRLRRRLRHCVEHRVKQGSNE
jgi:DNA-directed RNA polymerase specialized sigma24 family protein